MLTKEIIEEYNQYLLNEEKSANTVEKYIRDANAFMMFLNRDEITKGLVIGYRQS